MFVDTVHWVAIFNPKDGLHEDAKRVQAGLGTGARLLTTDFVLTEFLNTFAGRGEPLRKKAAEFVYKIRANVNCDVIPASRAHFDKALKLYDERADQDHSLTDCHSIVVMRERGVTDVLSTDACFRTEGFATLLRP